MSATDLAYFMGQGKAYIAPRIAGGAIAGPFNFVGDTESLKITSNQKFDDVEESTSGNRFVAAHIPVGLSLNAQMVNQQWSAQNLQRGLYGLNQGPNAAATVTAEAITAWSGSTGSQGVHGGAVNPVANPGISAVVVKLAGAATVLGSVVPNAAGTGSLAEGTRVTCGFTGMTATVSPVVVAVINASGGVDHYEVTSAGSGISVFPTALTVAGVTTPTQYINPGATTLVVTTDYTVDATNGAILGVSGSHILETGLEPNPTGIALVVDYAYAAWTAKIEGIITGIQEYAIRFQGLNTANGNAPVIVTLWRFAMDLAKMLDLIQAKHGQLDMSGMLLPDYTRNGTSQSLFYTVVKV